MANQSPAIIPSLLSANLLHLSDDISKLMQSGIRMIHLDIMDNHYVPNLTFGPDLAHMIHQQFPDLAIDVHLMTDPVDRLIEQFATAGVSRISIHPDATIHLDRSLQLIRSFNCQAGLVLNPATPIDMIRWCMHRLDFVLVMTVNPGFGGQTLIPDVILKIQQLHDAYPTLVICVDGGIHSENITTLANAGAHEFVVGSALFKEPHIDKTIQHLYQSLQTNPQNKP